MGLMGLHRMEPLLSMRDALERSLYGLDITAVRSHVLVVGRHEIRLSVEH